MSGEGPEVYRQAQGYSLQEAASRVEAALGCELGWIERDAVAGSHAVFFATLVGGCECALRVATSPHQSIEREQWVMEQCRVRGIPTPVVIASDPAPTDGSPPWLIASRLPGVPAHQVALTDSERHSVLAQLGDLAARMHGVSMPGFGPLLKQGSAFVGSGQSLCDEVIRRLPTLPPEALSPDWTLAIRERFQRERDSLDRRQGVLVHADLRFENALLVGTTVSALLDFELSCSGDPALDLASLLYCNGQDASDQTTLLQAYGRPDLLVPMETLSRRILLYQCFYALEHLFWEHAFADEAGIERERARLARLEDLLDRE